MDEDIHRITRDDYDRCRKQLISEYLDDNLIGMDITTVSVFISVLKENMMVYCNKYIDLIYTEVTPIPNPKHIILYRAMFDALSNDEYDSPRFLLARYALINRSRYWITDVLLDILTPEYLYSEYIFSEVYTKMYEELCNELATKLMVLFTGCGYVFDLTPCIELIRVDKSIYEEFSKTNTVIISN